MTPHPRCPARHDFCHTDACVYCAAIRAAADEARADTLRPYMAVQKLLDDVLGTEERDGVGDGIEADVMLALERVAEKAREEERGEIIAAGLVGVGLACGRLYLDVAGCVASVEGDMCRCATVHPELPTGTWNKERLTAVVDLFNAAIRSRGGERREGEAK